MPTPRTPSEAARRRRRDLRSMWWRYRPVALALLAMWLVVSLVPLLRPTTTPVVVATRDLTAGAVVKPGDVRYVDYPPRLAPRSVLTALEDAVGQQLRHAVAPGVPLVSGTLVGADWGLGPGEVAVPARLADPLVAQLLAPGDRLELVRADGEATVTLATEARVLALLNDPASGGFLAGAAAPSALLLLAVPHSAGSAVLDASARGTLFAALGGGSAFKPDP